MSIPYSFQNFGRFKLAAGFTSKYLHDRFGFDLGERFYRDVAYRIETTMAIDRAIYEEYSDIGLGYQQPFPRISIEPFGHRFVPVMFGCQCRYAPDAEPAVEPHPLSDSQIEALQPWDQGRFENAPAVQEVVRQARQLQQQIAARSDTEKEQFNPHYRRFSSLQNLGSVINSAFSVQGESLFMQYLDRPDLVRKFYANITDLMRRSLEFFPSLDAQPLRDVFLGNCSVAMISPPQYRDVNAPFDADIMAFSRTIGAAFTMHQDSNVTPNLENYARLDYVQGLDFGQDTDFELAAKLFPHAHANCILFPSWLAAHDASKIEDDLSRLMTVGLRFPSFSFTLYEIDDAVAGDRLKTFYQTFARCAETVKKGA